ncbi:adenosylhomocysteinase [Streptomyces sp. HUAS TT20]|uniref:adenosylhomocysteinase n=1 Tax=Streptomyces sp. HUAS TT20 TaxID=3447509 RepID=UPI0021D980D4|nr:adenosylhomocysteinase [Streptomyces sp. HUAS 15-9]UXY33125.1 adenosylhomocysteinase [Streptomyces sp. HUAS 15-9]
MTSLATPSAGPASARNPHTARNDRRTDRDFRVRDLSLAAQGRREIRLAEHEMPALMALRARYAGSAPLAGARITGTLHMTVQTAVLIETLVELGAQIRWAGSNVLSTQDAAAAAVAAGPGGDQPGVCVFAWKGQSPDEFWWCVDQALSWPDGDGPNMLLDDAACCTRLLHRGAESERTGTPPVAGPDDDELEAGLLRLLVARRDVPGYWSGLAARVRGVTEETTTGAHHVRSLVDSGSLLFPVVSVNDSVTKSKFDNIYGCRHSLVDGINRATDVLIGGKTAVVCGYGDVGKGCAAALRGQGARVIVTEIDPICALQAAMDGYQVAALDSVVEIADIVVTATGCPQVVTAEHLVRMKHQAVVGNMGHAEGEIDLAGLAEVPGIQRQTVRPQVDEWMRSDGRSLIVLSEGRLLNLGNATGHPSFVMSSSFANQVLAQLELYRGEDRYPIGLHTLPKQLDETVARLHLDALGVELTSLTARQASYLRVPVEGPYKPASYRY